MDKPILSTPLYTGPGVVLRNGPYIFLEVPSSITVKQARELAMALEQITADDEQKG